MSATDSTQKVVLLTGSTDGLGLEAAKMIVSRGHRLLLHGRSPAKLAEAEKALRAMNGGEVESFVADLSKMADVEALAKAVAAKHSKLDVLINNAGVFKTSQPVTEDGFDVRFAVNTIAPYLLMQRLMPLLGTSSRVINLSSAAQAPVDLSALNKHKPMSDGAAYSQSKLAITMWSRTLALALQGKGPVIIALNPGSMLGTNMVKDAFGVSGGDISIGADIITRTALDDEFADATGKYFDNDAKRFNDPHPDGLNDAKSQQLVRSLDELLAKLPK